MEWTHVKTVKKKKKFSLVHCTDRYHMFIIKQQQLRILIDGKSRENTFRWCSELFWMAKPHFTTPILASSGQKQNNMLVCSFSVKIKFRYIWLLTIIV